MARRSSVGRRAVAARKLGPHRSAGFTYIGLLIAVVILGLGLSAVGTVWRTQAQRERERELLFIGHEFETAIASYYNAGGGVMRGFPLEITDLLDDHRAAEPRHHLRRLYADPMTGKPDWTLLRRDSFGNVGSAGISGIASSSRNVPIKTAGFAVGQAAFKDAASYADWKFEFVPRLGRRKIGAVPAAAD